MSKLYKQTSPVRDWRSTLRNYVSANFKVTWHKNWDKYQKFGVIKFRYCTLVYESVVSCPPIVNGRGDSFWKWKDFQLSRACGLDPWIGSYCIPSLIDLYIHAKFHWNRSFLWMDVRTYLRMDVRKYVRTFETHIIRSTQKSWPKKLWALTSTTPD